MTTDSKWLIVLAVGAFVWPILVAALNRSSINGANEQRLKNIERDVANILSYFELRPKQTPRR